MPDFGAPVAQNVNADPTRGLTTIKDLMGLQQLKQTIQSGGLTIQQQQQNLEKGAASTQMEQQSAAQRKAIAGVDWSKYDDGAGTVSTDKMLADPELRRSAGDQLLEVVKSGAAIRGQQLQNKQTLVGLNDKLRDQFGATIGALRTDPDVIADNPAGRQKVRNAMTQFGQVGGPDAQRVADIYGQVVNHAPQGKLVRGISAIQLQAMDASRQAAAEGPEYTNTGGSQKQTNPLAAGGDLGPNKELPNTLSPQGGINPLTGQPYTIGGAAGFPVVTPEQQRQRDAQAMDIRDREGKPGFGGGVRTQDVVSGWPRLPSFPNPQQAQSATAAAAEADAVRNADSHPSTGYEPTRQVYSNLLGLVAKNPAIGPKSQVWNQLTGALTPFGASTNSTMQEVDSYLDRLALQNAGAAGLSTDAARHMSQVAAGTTEMNPQALKEKLRFGAATLEASHAYRQGLEKVVGPTNDNPIAKRAFDSMWTQNADIMAFRLLAAKKNGDKEGYDNTLKQIQALPPGQRASIQEHMRNLNTLSEGKMPR